MKGGKAELLNWKNMHMLFESFRKVVLPILTLILLLKFTFSSYNTNFLYQNLESSVLNDSEKTRVMDQKCNIFVGKWIPYTKRPYYTNETNCAIDDRQNCMKFGRPDSEFLHWRWKPDTCELPLFNATQFLELVRGKTMAFVGDSLARNQMQSLVCLLASAAIPMDVSKTKDTKFRRWLYKDYNFTIKALWSPQLIKSYESDPNGYSYDSLMKLYLDEPDDVWASQVDSANIVIISGGQWFFRPFLYYENSQLIGCHRCNESNVTKLSHYYGYRMAFRTSFKTILNLEKLNDRLVILRPFSPSHFENGEWNKGGNCNRTRPFKNQDSIKLDGYTLKMYLTQLEEFRAAEKEGKKKGVKFRLLDTTKAMVLRADGHPNHYGHWPNDKKSNADCVHWCMPGPVDTWNELLLAILKMERYGYVH